MWVSLVYITSTSGVASSLSSCLLHEKLIKQDRVAEAYVFTPFITLCSIVLLCIVSESTIICRILSFLSYIQQLSFDIAYYAKY